MALETKHRSVRVGNCLKSQTHLEPLALPEKTELFSKLSAERLLRIAAGQIYLARERADEIIGDLTLDLASQNRLCETVGRDLNNWFRFAVKALTVDNSQNDLVALFNQAVYLTNKSPFNGKAWFTGPMHALVGTWKDFYENCGKAIIEASCLCDRGRNIYIAEFQLNTLTASVKEAVVEMLSKWRIDDNDRKPQLGLEWTVTTQEFNSYLARDSAIVFIRVVDGQPKGVNITFTDILTPSSPEEGLPSPGGSKAARQWCDEQSLPYSSAMYDYLIATDKDESLHTKAGGYRLLLEATEQTACLLGKEIIFGGVRIESPTHAANTAIEIHNAVGWKTEELLFTSGLTGATLKLISRAVPQSFSFKTHSSLALQRPSVFNLNPILADPKELAEKDRLDVNAIRDGESAETFANKFLEINNIAYQFNVTATKLSGGQHGIFIQQNNIPHYYLQVRPNQDLWMKVDCDEIYTFASCMTQLYKQAFPHIEAFPHIPYYRGHDDQQEQEQASKDK